MISSPNRSMRSCWLPAWSSRNAFSICNPRSSNWPACCRSAVCVRKSVMTRTIGSRSNRISLSVPTPGSLTATVLTVATISGVKSKRFPPCRRIRIAEVKLFMIATALMPHPRSEVGGRRRADFRPLTSDFRPPTSDFRAPLSRPDRNRFAALINGHVGNLSLRHAHQLMRRNSALGFDRDANGERRVSEPHSLSIKTDQIADENRRDELDLVHGHRHHLFG